MKIIDTLKNVWNITELKDRIILTLGLLLVYRFGAQVVLPGIDASQLGGLASGTDGGILGILNMFTGGAFANNHYQLDYLGGYFRDWKDYVNTYRHFPDYFEARILVVKL